MSQIFSHLPLPVESRTPTFAGATGWLNTDPVTPADVHGKVVVVQFWTYTCINWLRTLPYIRTWAGTYAEKGLLVVGVHTPEFGVEHEIENVRRAAHDMRIEYPIAIDNDYAVWNAFANQYWPALYIADAEGRIRHHHFGEGGYERSEHVIRQLLTDAGTGEFSVEPVPVEPLGIELPADGRTLRSAETYVGYARSEGFSSPGDVAIDEPVRFRVQLDGQPPGDARGLDVDEGGNGVVEEPRLYQLIRQSGHIADRQFEIEFLDPGTAALCFTFG